MIVVWVTFIYIWPTFTRTLVLDWYSLDKQLLSLYAWFVSIQRRIVAVWGLGRPIPLPLDMHTHHGAIGAQRGLQRALGVHVPP